MTKRYHNQSHNTDCYIQNQRRLLTNGSRHNQQWRLFCGSSNSHTPGWMTTTMCPIQQQHPQTSTTMTDLARISAATLVIKTTAATPTNSSPFCCGISSWYSAASFPPAVPIADDGWWKLAFNNSRIRSIALSDRICLFCRRCGRASTIRSNCESSGVKKYPKNSKRPPWYVLVVQVRCTMEHFRVCPLELLVAACVNSPLALTLCHDIFDLIWFDLIWFDLIQTNKQTDGRRKQSCGHFW